MPRIADYKPLLHLTIRNQYAIVSQSFFAGTGPIIVLALEFSR